LPGFDEVTLRKASLPIGADTDSFTAGRDLGSALLGPELRAVFVLSDGLHANGSRLADGMNDLFPDSVVVTGGLAGDGERFGSTWVLADRDARRQVSSPPLASMARVCESVMAATPDGRASARAPGRRPRVGNVLYELDGKPALALYKDYLGERAAGLPATAMLFPLSIRRDAGDANPLIRSVLGVDEADAVADLCRRYSAGSSRAADAHEHRPAHSRARVSPVAPPRRISRMADRRSRFRCRASDGGWCSANAPTRRSKVSSMRFRRAPGISRILFIRGNVASASPDRRCDLHNQTMTVTLLDEA
jgi:hypothetical protein